MIRGCGPGSTAGVVWMPVGEDVEGPELAAKVVSAARLFDPAAAEVTDPVAAGGVLGRVLDGRRVLLVVDDVWSTAQVEPFLIGGDRVVRLFTTRQPGVLPDRVARVRVDQMDQAEAQQLLTAGLPPLPPVWSPTRCGRRDAGRCCSRWCTARSATPCATVQIRPASCGEVLAALAGEGITALDATNAGGRSTAVAATIEVSLRRLTPDEQARYRELAVFGEDVAIPGDGGGPAVGTHRGVDAVSGPTVVPPVVRPRAAGVLSARPRSARAARRGAQLPARHVAGAAGPSGTRPWSTRTATWCPAEGGWADLPARARPTCGRGWPPT